MSADPIQRAQREQARVLFRLVHVLAALTLLFVATLAIAPAKSYFSEWRSVQNEYNRRAEAAGLTPVEVKIRQIWRPEIEQTDRCVTCHLGMGDEKPLPDGGALFGEHPDVGHEVAAMGCTICHRGQGLATTGEAAHGQVKHWDDPMLPREHLQASCAQCHLDGARVPPLSRFERGSYLYELHGCSSCHEGGRVGPDLRGVALRGYPRDWPEKHASVRGSKLTDDEIAAVGDYLDASIGAPVLERGKALAMELGCRGCHRIGGLGGDDGPDLSNNAATPAADRDFSGVEGPRNNETWQRAHLRAPDRVSPGSVMPAYQLAPEDEDALVTYILSLRQPTVAMDFLPKHTVLAKLQERRDYPKDGAALFQIYCSACHGAGGEGRVMKGMGITVPAIANADVLSMMSEGYLRRTLANGRPGRHMPAWGTKEAGLSQEEIDLLVGHLLGLRAEPPSFDEVRAADADVSHGATIFQHDCSGCHGIAGEGTPIAPSVVNDEFLFVADDAFLYETIARGRADTAMPSHAHYDARALASVIAWIDSHRDGAGEPTEGAPANGHDGLREKVLPKLFVTELSAYRSNGSPAAGRALFGQLCVGCHGEAGHGAVAPAIGNPAFLRTASDGFLAGTMLLGRGERPMRPFDSQGIARMNASEIGDIIAYLRRSAAELGHGRLRGKVHSNPLRGAELYAQYCVSCHGERGDGGFAPALANPGFLASVTDGFLQATIARGRRGTAMRGWLGGAYGFAELTPEDVNDLVAYIRSLEPPPARTDSEKGTTP